MSVLRLARRAMGTEFELVLIGDNEIRLRCSGEAALEEIDRVEEQLSAFLPTSEVSSVTARAGRRVPVSPTLAELLADCERLREETRGAFDVTVGAVTALEDPDAHQQKWARAHLAVRHRMVLHAQSVELTRGAALDLGGIGKGYAIDRAIAVVREHGVEHAFLHGGRSTSYALGCPPGEKGWPVAQGEARLFLRDEALSVSRRREPDEQGVRRRIVDAACARRDPRPEAWVRCASATEADALSTAFLLADDAVITACLKVRPGAHADFPAPCASVTRRKVLKGAAAAAAAFAVLSTGATVRADDENPEPKKILKPISIGVVGAGVHGRLLLGQLARMDAVEVPAICDLDENALKAAVKIAGRGVETYQDLDYMLEEESLDALVVATPTHRHAAPTIAALEDGLHVFVEAPLARSVEDAKRIVRAAATAKRVVHTGHQRRTSRLYPTVSEHAASGALGKVLQLRAGWNRKQSWRRGGATKKTEREVNWHLYRGSSGGLLLEQGSHAFDMGNWLFGCLPEAVTGFGALQHWKDGREVDDSVQVVLRYPKGRQLSYQASLVNGYGGTRELIVGDQASILCMGQHKALLFKEADAVAIGWEQYAKTELLGGKRGIVVDPDATKYVSHEKGEVLGSEADKADYHAALEAFATAVRGDEQDKVPCDVRAGMHAAVIALGAEEALREGKVITFTNESFEV